MTSKKKESTGIALLSMYNDEDDDMEEDRGEYDEHEQEEDQNSIEEKAVSNMDEDTKNNSEEPSIFDNTLELKEDNSSPQQYKVLKPSPHIQLEAVRSWREKLTIVDYGHDEVAMSPEAEEGEILTAGHVMFGTEIPVANGTPSKIDQVLTPNTQTTPRAACEELDASQSDRLDNGLKESEPADAEDAVKISVDSPNDIDPIDKFLPPPPSAKCSDELQRRINKFIGLKKSGKCFNEEVRKKKDYRNPDFLLHAVRYQDIDQIGSCFSKDVFDPHGYDKSDYYDEIEAGMKREMERKEQERKKSQKVDFVTGGTQPGTVPNAHKVNAPNSVFAGLSSATTGLVAVSTVDVNVRDGRHNKKSKWDKVVGDGNTLSSGGRDSLSSLGAHASLLSAPKAGAGYTAFAQHRRREAEERRSSEKKTERRS